MNSPIMKESNLIIAGLWNVAILNPLWLKKQFPTLIASDKFSLNFAAGPTTPRLFYRLEEITIAPDSEQLVFILNSNDDKKLNYISELALEIFKKLPHTPIIAVGSNFIYELKSNESFNINKFLDIEKENEFYLQFFKTDFIDREVKHTFNFDNYQINIFYFNLKSCKSIKFNFNYPATSREKIELSINNFKKHYDESKEFVSKLIGEPC